MDIKEVLRLIGKTADSEAQREIEQNRLILEGLKYGNEKATQGLVSVVEPVVGSINKNAVGFAESVPSWKGRKNLYEDYKDLKEEDPESGFSNVIGALTGQGNDSSLVNTLRVAGKADDAVASKVREKIPGIAGVVAGEVVTPSNYLSMGLNTVKKLGTAAKAAEVAGAAKDLEKASEAAKAANVFKEERLASMETRAKNPLPIKNTKSPEQIKLELDAAEAGADFERGKKSYEDLIEKSKNDVVESINKKEANRLERKAKIQEAAELNRELNNKPSQEDLAKGLRDSELGVEVDTIPTIADEAKIETKPEVKEAKPMSKTAKALGAATIGTAGYAMLSNAGDKAEEANQRGNSGNRNNKNTENTENKNKTTPSEQQKKILNQESKDQERLITQADLAANVRNEEPKLPESKFENKTELVEALSQKLEEAERDFEDKKSHGGFWRGVAKAFSAKNMDEFVDYVENPEGFDKREAARAAQARAVGNSTLAQQIDNNRLNRARFAEEQRTNSASIINQIEDNQRRKEASSIAKNNPTLFGIAKGFATGPDGVFDVNQFFKFMNRFNTMQVGVAGDTQAAKVGGAVRGLSSSETTETGF